MEVTYQTTMHCGSCLSKLKPYLDKEPAIQSWSADLNDPRKLVRVELGQGVPKSRIVELVKLAGFDATEIPPDEESAAPETLVSIAPAEKELDAPAFGLATYKPLFLVLAYVIGATLFVESIYGDLQWHRAMGHFMGFFFLGFAFFKLLNVSAFATAFETYDVVAKRSHSYALAYPFVELGLGVLYLSHQLPILANVVTALVMGVGLIGVVGAVRQRRAIQCACLGTAFNLPMSVVTIIENSTMLAMAIGMLTA